MFAVFCSAVFPVFIPIFPKPLSEFGSVTEAIKYNQNTADTKQENTKQLI